MRAWIASTGCALLAVNAGCLHEMSPARVAPGAPAAPGVRWVAPPGLVAAPSPAPRPEIPADLIDSAQHMGLANLVDLALRDSPRTREAWAQARSAAAALGASKGAYYPTVGLQLDRTTSKTSALGGAFSFFRNSYGSNATLTWVLLDWGGRSASIEMARQALIAADWTHNAVMQDVVLDVEKAYYNYLNTRALLESRTASVKEAQANLDAASRRREAGVGTIGEVLQSKTALSQAQLDLQTTEGQIQTIKGALATAVGLPANTRYEIEAPAEEFPVGEFTEEVDRLIEQAAAKRPDLAAARARAAEAEARIGSIRSTGLPSLVTNWGAGVTYYDQIGSSNSSTVETYNGALLLRVPVFNGFSLQYDLMRVRSDAEAARARVDELSQEIISQVWSGFYDLRTATQRIETTRDLLDSAQQSYDVSLGRYKAGVGSILDLITSQASLDKARAQQAQARTDWHLSLAQLAHDTGTLGVLSEPDKEGTP
ncbi:MAG TPA: TolC family protein [Patescibacteria group bacterium]|nr:TolC family protein [Patescibacteria group bacterium]